MPVRVLLYLVCEFMTVLLLLYHWITKLRSFDMLAGVAIILHRGAMCFALLAVLQRPVTMLHSVETAPAEVSDAIETQYPQKVGSLL